MHFHTVGNKPDMFWFKQQMSRCTDVTSLQFPHYLVIKTDLSHSSLTPPPKKKSIATDITLNNFSLFSGLS